MEGSRLGATGAKPDDHTGIIPRQGKRGKEDSRDQCDQFAIVCETESLTKET